MKSFILVIFITVSAQVSAQTVFTDSLETAVVKIYRQDIDFYNVLDSIEYQNLSIRYETAKKYAYDPYGTTINYFLKVRVDRTNRESAIASLIRSYYFYPKTYAQLKKKSKLSLNKLISNTVKEFNSLLKEPVKPPKYYITVGTFHGGACEFRNDFIIPLEFLTFPSVDSVSFADSTLKQTAINEKMLPFYLSMNLAGANLSDPNSFNLNKLNPFSSKGYISVQKFWSFVTFEKKPERAFNFGQNNLADECIKSGIALYVAEKANPEGFREFRKRVYFDSKTANEKQLWKEILPLLKSTDEPVKNAYISMETGMKSKYIMLGGYFGYRIISDYMEKSKATLDELLGESDYEKMYSESGWKEKETLE